MAYNLFKTRQTQQPVQQQVADGADGTGAVDGMNGFNGSNGQSGQSPQVQQFLPKNQPTAPAVDPNDPTSGMNTITSMYTSPEQEEKMRKASVANQRILAIGDALRHIGNIYHTTRYAPAQQFNSPVVEEQQRYEKGKALRDAANMKFYTYQQAKAAQDAKQRQWELDFQRQLAKDKADQELKQKDFLRKLGYTEAQIKKMEDDGILARDKFEADKKHKEEQRKETKRHHTVTESQGAQKIAIQRQNANNGGGGKGGSNPTSLRGVNGWYSKKMSSDESRAFYNQTYNEMKKRGIINESSVLAGLPADTWGQKSISFDAKRAAVENALIEHPEVGDWLAEEFEFEFDPRYKEFGTPTQQQPTPNFGYTPVWQGGKNLGIGIGSNQNNNGGKKLGIGL